MCFNTFLMYNSYNVRYNMFSVSGVGFGSEKHPNSEENCYFISYWEGKNEDMNKSMSASKSYTRQILTKVPEITVYFWITKVLTTGMGEVFSDYLVQSINPIIAVALTGMALAASIFLQFKVLKYIAWIYWLVVVMVSIFGTMAADVLHVVIGIPYVITTTFFALVLAVIIGI